MPTVLRRPSCYVLTTWPLLFLLGALSGCQVVGVAVEHYRRDATKTVAAESLALEGKSFAVIVTADRSIQGDFPNLPDMLAVRITERLANPANLPPAAGFVPPADVLRYIYDNPSWYLKDKKNLADALGGVDRLVILELLEYRLHDPGNAYVWNAVAAGTVSVYDPSSFTPEIAVMEKLVTVKFPDKIGLGPDDMDATLVNAALSLRMVDRTSWLFYDHQEPYYPTY